MMTSSRSMHGPEREPEGLVISAASLGHAAMANVHGESSYDLIFQSPAATWARRANRLVTSE